MFSSKNIEEIIWNEEEYKNFIQYLISLKDNHYKEFHSSLVLNSKYEMIGIRVPIMRDIAKKISKGNIEDFLKYAMDNYYEEIMIQGFVISKIKDESIFFIHFEKFIKKIDNWAICDSFCNSIKIVRKYESKYFEEAIKLSLSNEEFTSRVGLVMILNHFISKDKLNIIFDTLNKIDNDKFYINMAIAWLVCEMYIKFSNETEEFLKDNKLNVFTQNKAISKINDSYRVSEEKKEAIKSTRWRK